MNKDKSIGSHTGLILVDHGSRRPQANAVVVNLVGELKAQTGYAIVEPAHMELATPTIADAVSSCVFQGAQLLWVIPFFLAPGRHVDQHIPQLVTQAVSKHEGVCFEIAEPLGLHRQMIQLVKAQIQTALSP